MKPCRTFVKSMWLWLVIVCCCVGPGVRPVAGEQGDMLRIAVGKPTVLVLDSETDQYSASVAASRTGAVAAFYPPKGVRGGNKLYRISTDRGLTWGEERSFPPGTAGPMSIGLQEGGVLFIEGQATPVKDGKPGELEVKRDIFSDDFLHFEAGTSSVLIPNAGMSTKWAKFWPPFEKGKITQLANGDLMATMYGNFKGDTEYRTWIMRSTDLGKSWQYHATVACNPKDPDPSLPGSHSGFCEPSLALLPDGRFLCVMRIQGSHWTGEYRPMYASWSDASGKTWTKPVPTNPHLMNIYPTLEVLDNGVVACQYGRPGFHVAFSKDAGHTWQDRITFSDEHVPLNTGMFDMVKVGPNRLVAIGSDSEGIKVWPIDVERVKVSSVYTKLTGCVLDQAGQPVAGAKVELGPNRYTADSWMEGKDYDPRNGSRKVLTPPVLGYQSISEEKGHPIVETDNSGQFKFENVRFAEYVLTVEADGYAPQWRHINVKPEPQSHLHTFQLKTGKSVRGRVVDQTGTPVGGACVVLDAWHIHADPDGFFHGAINAPVPDKVLIRVYKRYSDDYGTFEQKLSPSQIEKQLIVLPSKK